MKLDKPLASSSVIGAPVTVDARLTGYKKMLSKVGAVRMEYSTSRPLRDELTQLFASGESTVVYATTEPTEALLLGGHTAVLDAGPAPDKDVVIVGAGPAGLAAAIRLLPPISRALGELGFPVPIHDLAPRRGSMFLGVMVLTEFTPFPPENMQAPNATLSQLRLGVVTIGLASTAAAPKISTSTNLTASSRVAGRNSACALM